MSQVSLVNTSMYCFMAVALFFSQAYSLQFNLPNNAKKCVKEEIHKGVLVKGDYDLSPAAVGQSTTLHVGDTRGHTLYNKANAEKGKFSFTTEEYDIFEICLETTVTAGQRAAHRQISLSIKHGVEAKTYDQLAKAEKMKPLEVELRRLEDLSDSIVRDFAYMRAREEEMRSTNESTHTRVLYLSVFSMLALFGLATWQVLYLRRYFKSKKLID